VSRLLPENAKVLDVGSGDGSVARAILELRPDLEVRGLDTLVRDETLVPVERFDGSVLPLPGRSVDAVTFIDVLHHTVDPTVLLREASRVARRAIVIKETTPQTDSSPPRPCV
jgi:ubiquinone/menaquinone biosynthesis C-methylase UbiE